MLRKEDRSKQRRRRKWVYAAATITTIAVVGLGFWWRHSSIDKKVSDQASGNVTTKRRVESTNVNSRQTRPATDKMTQTGNKFWTTGQDKALSKFMSSWQDSSGQKFQGTYNQEKVNYLGLDFPDRLIFSNDDSYMTYVFDQAQGLRWNDESQRTVDIRVVAAAVGGEPSGKHPKLYLFGYQRDKYPVVLAGRTTNGQRLYFYEAEDANLRNGFAKIALSSTNPEIVRSNVSDWHWTEDSLMDYVKSIGPKQAKEQAAATALTEYIGMAPLTFKDYGRTGHLVEDGRMWTVTKGQSGSSLVMAYNLTRMNRAETVVNNEFAYFEVRDSDKYVTSWHYTKDNVAP